MAMLTSPRPLVLGLVSDRDDASRFRLYCVLLSWLVLLSEHMLDAMWEGWDVSRLMSDGTRSSILDLVLSDDRRDLKVVVGLDAWVYRRKGLLRRPIMLRLCSRYCRT